MPVHLLTFSFIFLSDGWLVHLLIFLCRFILYCLLPNSFLCLLCFVCYYPSVLLFIIPFFVYCPCLILVSRTEIMFLQKHNHMLYKLGIVFHIYDPVMWSVKSLATCCNSMLYKLLYLLHYYRKLFISSLFTFIAGEWTGLITVITRWGSRSIQDGNGAYNSWGAASSQQWKQPRQRQVTAF